MKKKWVVVLPCGPEVVPTIEELKKRGYQVAGIDQDKNAPAFQYADKSIIAPLNDYEQILFELKNENILPECFIPIVSDKAVLPAYVLNSIFRKNEQNNNVLAFYSKSILRTTLEKNRFPVPAFYVVSEKNELPSFQKRTKVIVKPDDSAGSRGITIIDQVEKEELGKAFDFAMQFSSNKKVIIEDYIDGEEYMIDCFIDKNKVVAVLVSEKKKIEDKVSWLIYTLNQQEFPYDRLKSFIEKLSKTLSYEKGPMHIELKYSNGKFYILDLAVRGGGFGVYNYYVHKALGFSFVNATIEAYLNRKISEKLKKHREGLIYFLTPAKEGIIDQITCSYVPDKNEDVKINYFYKKGQRLTMEVTDGNRLAGIYCFADTKPQLSALFDKVKKSIKIDYQDEPKGNSTND